MLVSILNSMKKILRVVGVTHSLEKLYTGYSVENTYLHVEEEHAK